MQLNLFGPMVRVKENHCHLFDLMRMAVEFPEPEQQREEIPLSATQVRAARQRRIIRFDTEILRPLLHQLREEGKIIH